MNYYKRHLGDYMTGTSHLSMLEHGAYTKLLDFYYSKEIPLQPSQCERIANAHTTAERKAVATVLKEFFELLPEGWRNHRCDRVIREAHEKADKASLSAKSRWNKESVDANALPMHSEGNASHKPLAKEKQEHVPRAARFEEWWLAYPVKKEKKGARAKWISKRLDDRADELIADVKNRILKDDQWLRGFVPHPTTYLNGERWTDELSAPRRQETLFAKPEPPIGGMARQIFKAEPKTAETTEARNKLLDKHLAEVARLAGVNVGDDNGNV